MAVAHSHAQRVVTTLTLAQLVPQIAHMCVAQDSTAHLDLWLTKLVHALQRVRLKKSPSFVRPTRQSQVVRLTLWGMLPV